MSVNGSANRVHDIERPHAAWDAYQRNRQRHESAVPNTPLAQLAVGDTTQAAAACWVQSTEAGDAARDAIVQLYKRHHLPMTEIAKRTGVSLTTVGRIVRSWPGSRT